ncbi:tRNA (cytosine(34)-C(5))-methyltransferase-like [Dendronephthya gigantea]|uniref:tRNA (cytosine(34)-C(5))-methyltransferase-like n=1 Tax=Dendronephthya gigantea TaxID=151771 RepID=UPI00106A85BF|nr:tRNA (cytosine(34)-C(5))-methyltransferase-like [Dendronephthya gigantea]
MSRKKGNRGPKKKNSHFSGKRKPRESYDDIVKENELLEKFYKAQHVVPEDEWESFMESLRAALPSTFRITGIRGHAEELLKYLKKYYIEKLNGAKEELGEELDCFGKPLTWYPDELAWQINLTRRFIRRSGMVSNFHKFLIHEAEMGNLSRQEAVSMIPPLLIDVEPHHKILDLCAAPGSKTAQLIEMLHEKEPTTLPEGFVIANDIDPKRCYMLVHQSRRIHSPCCLVTNHDAASFPDINIKQEGSEEVSPMLFDRILCDVPCSGDGTMRKNPQIWKKWNPEIGVNLHKIQLRILVRAVEMLAIGGRVVYSTCSMNPVEDEAVVSQLLLRTQGSVELIDVSDRLPLLKRSPGLLHWKIQTKDGRPVPSFTECSTSDRTHGFLESMWPPSIEDAEKFNLKRCWRLYPHQQDTGGFFIAVLEKKSPLPWTAGFRPHHKLLPWEITKKEKKESKRAEVIEDENEGKVTENMSKENENNSAELRKPSLENCEETTNEKDLDKVELEKPAEERTESDVKCPGVTEPQRKRRKFDPKSDCKENPFVFVEDVDTHWNTIRKFYEISSDFPESVLLVRSASERKRTIYFVSVGLAAMLKNVDQEKFNVINAGLRLFTRCENSDQDWSFRINGEALETILPFLSNKRVINVPQEDLVRILVDTSPKVSQMTTETKSALGNIGPGCIVFSYDPKNRKEVDTLSVKIAVCGWRSNTVILRSLIAKGDRMHYLRIAGYAPDSQEIQALVSDPKVSLEEPSFQVETDSPTSEQVDSNSSMKIKDQTEEEMLDDTEEDMVEPSTLTDNVASEQN